MRVLQGTILWTLPRETHLIPSSSSPWQLCSIASLGLSCSQQVLMSTEKCVQYALSSQQLFQETKPWPHQWTYSLSFPRSRWEPLSSNQRELSRRESSLTDVGWQWWRPRHNRLRVEKVRLLRLTRAQKLDTARYQRTLDCWQSLDSVHEHQLNEAYRQPCLLLQLHGLVSRPDWLENSSHQVLLSLHRLASSSRKSSQ